MTFTEKVLDYARMAAGIDAFIRSPVAADPLGEIRRRVADRESLWLDLVRRAVFDVPAHPYHEMFRLAGCEFGDLENAVRRDGLEPALERLHSEGVRLSNDEFKGRKPIIRNGKTIPATTADFRNPLSGAKIYSSSGGSGGTPTRTPQSPRFHAYLDGYRRLNAQEFAPPGTARIHLKPLLPGTAGLPAAIGAARIGSAWDHWFSFGGPARDSAHYRGLTNAMVALARLRGYKVPFPEHLPPNDFRPAARAIARRRGAGTPVYVGAFASAGARVALAAVEQGLDIRGTVFALSSEAVTAAKRQAVRDSGCRVVNRYWISEIGPIGFGCLNLEGRGVHLMRDAVAVFTRRRPAPFSDAEVNALQFTTLLPFCHHVLINAEMDDAATLQPCECDCRFARMGSTHALFDISSFGKLTGSGMSLAGTDMVHILETVLPARFGGGPGDYQLVQREEAEQTELVLRMAPHLPDARPDDVKDFVLRQIRGLFGGAEASRVWKHAEALQVVREAPVMTARGKILPLQLLRGDPPHATQRHAS